MADQPGTLGGQLSGSIDRIRDVAKWLITAFAAVAGIMVAGSQLSGIGKLEVGWRLLLAVIGGLMAVSGAAWAIWMLTEVLLPEETTVTDVLTDARDKESLLAGTLAAYPELLLEYPDVDALNGAYQAARTEQQNAQRIADAAPADQAALRQVESASANADRLGDALRQLTPLAAYYRQKKEFKNSRRLLYCAALLTAVGLGTFAWAANPPEEKSSAVSTPVTVAPAPVRVRLNADGRQTLAPLLGANCVSQAAATGVDGLALAATADTVDIVIIPSDSCDRPVRFSLVLTQGVAIPSLVVIPPTPSPSPG